MAALPTSESTLCYFVTCLVQHGPSDSTIRTYLSGIRQLQISYGLQEPLINQMPRLHQTFFSFCRSGETTVGGDAKYDPDTHLSYSDVAVDDQASPSIVSLFIKQSKTD